MQRVLLSMASFVGVSLALPGLAAAKVPVASALLSARSAVALVGGPLDEVTKSEEKATAENGHDQNSICGYFPKGYRPTEVDRPPERGVQLSLHTFPSKAEARKFFDLTRSAEQEMARAFPGARLSPLKGIGEAAILSTKRLQSKPKSEYQVAIATFWKGSTMAQLTVWQKGAAAGGSATTGARQIAARLP